MIQLLLNKTMPYFQLFPMSKVDQSSKLNLTSGKHVYQTQAVLIKNEEHEKQVDLFHKNNGTYIRWEGLVKGIVEQSL